MERGIFVPMLMCLQLCTLSRCLPTPESCPPAQIGEDYSLYCYDSTISHNRIVRWVEHTHNDTIAMSSCRHNVDTASCSQENWAVCLEEVTYTVKTCIHTGTGVEYGAENDTDSSKDTAADKYAEVGTVSFNNSLTLKNVTADDDGRVFQCKVLDEDSKQIHVATQCTIVVTDETTRKYPPSTAIFGISRSEKIDETSDPVSKDKQIAVFIFVLIIVIGVVVLGLLVIMICYICNVNKGQIGETHNGTSVAMKPLIIEKKEEKEEEEEEQQQQHQQET